MALIGEVVPFKEAISADGREYTPYLQLLRHEWEVRTERQGVRVLLTKHLFRRGCEWARH